MSMVWGVCDCTMQYYTRLQKSQQRSWWPSGLSWAANAYWKRPGSGPHRSGPLGWDPSL